MKSCVLAIATVGLLLAAKLPDQDKAPGKGFIGATVRVNYENNEVNGILLVEIIKDGPADKAGLMANDIVIQIDDKPTKDLNAFREIVLNHKPGDEVIIHFTREGKQAEFRLKIGERPS
ncbi:MAG: PDZ domain-containing protein [Gemmataceae bacterium]